MQGLPYRPLLLVAIAAGLGIVADRYCGAMLVGGVYLWWAASVLGMVVCIGLWRCEVNRSCTWALLLTALCVGGAWHHLRWNYFAADDLARFARVSTQPVCIEAVAIDRTRRSPAPKFNPLRAIPARSRSETLVRITRIRDGTEWRVASGNCRLRVAGDLNGIHLGDHLRVFARFNRPQLALNPGQYERALAQRSAGRHSALFCREPECVTVVESATASPAGRWLDHVGRSCRRRISRYVGAENSDLALAILFGARERLSDATKESFLRTGTVHLLVVSGLHIGMLAGLVWFIVRSGFLPRRGAVLVTALLVIAYALIAGGRPPVVRATTLVLLALISLVVGRRVSVKVLLAAAALVVLAYNPSELFRAGTQLSFLCVAALSAYGYRVKQLGPPDPLTRLIRSVEPRYRKTLRWAGGRFGSLTIASLVTWLVAAPLVAYHFHIATPIGIAITPIIWPLVAGALITGLGICTLGWIFPPLAHVLGTFCAVCLSLTETVVGLAEQIDVGHLFVPGPAVWWLLVFYGALALSAMVPQFQVGWAKLTALAALWAALGLAVAAGQGHEEDQLQCTFLAMGHGTCVVLELPGGQTVLYDAGSLASPTGASQTIASYLWSRGKTQIDAVVLSHADVDHYNAMPGLLERFDIGGVYVSPLMFDPWATEGQLDAPEFLRTTLQEAEIPLHEIWMNDRLRVAHPDVEIEVLHPPRYGMAGRDNANSILLRVSYAGHSILLPGDLESPGMEAVLAEPPLDCDILLAPHHGSSNSDPPGFAAWCRPEWVVVSGRQIARDTLANVSYRSVGAQVLHTASDGAVRFTLSTRGIEVSTHRNSETR